MLHPTQGLPSRRVAWRLLHPDYRHRPPGDLFHGDAAARRRNSPLWLYHQHGFQGAETAAHLPKQDSGRRRSPISRCWSASRGNPRVSFLDFPTGGHNYRNYRRYLPDALQ